MLILSFTTNVIVIIILHEGRRVASFPVFRVPRTAQALRVLALRELRLSQSKSR